MSKFHWIKPPSQGKDSNNSNKEKNDAFQKLLLSRVPMDSHRQSSLSKSQDSQEESKEESKDGQQFQRPLQSKEGLSSLGAVL